MDFALVRLDGRACHCCSHKKHYVAITRFISRHPQIRFRPSTTRNAPALMWNFLLQAHFKWAFDVPIQLCWQRAF